MEFGTLIGQMRKEFNQKLNEMMAQELRQQELEKTELEKLASEIPDIVLPKLTKKEEERGRELIAALDKQVSKMAELTHDIGKITNEYRPTLTELTSLLANKDHDIHVKYSPPKLKFMLNELGRIIGSDYYNAALGFKSFPSKDTIEARMHKYQGI